MKSILDQLVGTSEPLNEDDEVCAIVLSQCYFGKLLKAKHLNAFEYLRPNQNELSTIYGFPVFISPIVKDFKVLTRREYKLLYPVLKKEKPQ